MTIGEKIRKIRREKDLSQEYVAELVGITPAYVSRIENGKNDPDSELIKKFAIALSVSPADFFESEVEPSSQPRKPLKGNVQLNFSTKAPLRETERKKIEQFAEDIANRSEVDRELVFEMIDRILGK